MSALAMHLGADLENLPAPPSSALPWIFALLLALWLALRVVILRSHLRARAEDEPAPKAWAPLLGLARNPLALPALLLLILALAGGLYLAWSSS